MELKIIIFNFSTKFYIVDETPSELSENKSEKMKNEKLMKLAGLDAKLNEIIKIIRTTFQFSESLNIAPIKGIIIHGPSGIGKSSILKKISQELKEFFFLKIEINKLLTKVEKKNLFLKKSSNEKHSLSNKKENEN